MISQTDSTAIEVSGETVLGVVNSVRLLKPKILQILARVGIGTPTRFTWYPQPKWLGAFKMLEEEIGSVVFFQIGRSIPEYTSFPGHIHDIHVALQMLDVVYQRNHRGGEIGFYKYVKTSECGGLLECQTPYPSDFDRGIIAGIVQKYAIIRTSVSVTLDETRPSRKNGGDGCTFMVTW